MRTLILAASALALLATPALAKKSAAPAAATTSNSMTSSTASTTAAKSKGTSKMAGCAAQWKAMGDTGHVKYNDMAKTMKSKKGGKMSGYNAWTAECMKKA